MFKRSKNESPVKAADGLTCHLLLQQSDVRGDKLAVTWVDVEPGCRQIPHRHLPEQVYVIVNGQGVMRVGDEYQAVAVGDVVYVPSNVVHGIENNAQEKLTYITAATPGFDTRAFYDSGEVLDGKPEKEAIQFAEPLLV